MNHRFLWRFLQDRLGLVVAWYIHTGVLLLLGELTLRYEGATLLLQVPYAFLLSTAVLLLTLLFQLARDWPFASQVDHLLESEMDLEALGNLPAANSVDQERFQALIRKLHGLAVAERLHYHELHQRQLTFIHMWVHQMKTPLSAIHLVAQQTAARDPHDAREAMESIQEETAKLTDGLEMVLNMARLQDFAVDYRVARVDLNSLVRQVVNGRKKQFIRLGIFPETKMSDLTVLTDEKWCAFALDQIIANALKYGSQSGKAEQRLRIGATATEDAVTLTISDQGPGIPPQDLPRVFHPFFTGENGRRFADATGIGLFLVKQVLDQLGHSISIQSAEGRGTTVAVTFHLSTL